MRAKGRIQSLFQLHGLSDDQWMWIQRSNIASYVRYLPMIVVLPDGGTSGYLNWKESGRLHKSGYESMIIDDISTHLQSNFRVTDGPWAIGGLSMGGYGAMRLGLKYPERFASIWAHSSAFHIGDLLAGDLVDEGTVEDASVYLHADRLKASGCPQPVITFDCGVDDELIQHNRDFDEHLTRIGLDHTYAEHPGAHTWEYWNEHVQAALDQHARALGIESTKPMNGNG